MKKRTVYSISRYDLRKVKDSDCENLKEYKELLCSWCEEKIILTGEHWEHSTQHDYDDICEKCKDLKQSEKQYSGFYIRILHGGFIPCDTCQDRLDRTLFGKTWDISDETTKVSLCITKDYSYFTLHWIFDKGITGTFYTCKECHKKLLRMIEESSEYTIGNKDYSPPIEFYRRWDIDEKETEELDKKQTINKS